MHLWPTRKYLLIITSVRLYSVYSFLYYGAYRWGKSSGRVFKVVLYQQHKDAPGNIGDGWSYVGKKEKGSRRILWAEDLTYTWNPYLKTHRRVSVTLETRTGRFIVVSHSPLWPTSWSSQHQSETPKKDFKFHILTSETVSCQLTSLFLL